MQKTIITINFKDTQKTGEEFAYQIKGGEVLALYGDLGSGKTTFMQGLAKGLGIKKNIISPTFIIMRTYEIPSSFLGERSELRDEESLRLSSGIKNLYHLDLYRIENEAQAEDLGLLELMGEPENIVAVEWPDKIENILPDTRINIYFTYMEDDKREIRINF